MPQLFSLNGPLTPALLPTRFMPTEPLSTQRPVDGEYFIWQQDGVWSAVDAEGGFFSPASIDSRSQTADFAVALASARPALLLDEEGWPLGLIQPAELCATLLRLLRRSQAMNKAVLATADEMICGIDEAGVVNQFNQRAEEFYKISHDDIIGRHITEFFSDLVITQVQYNAISSGEAVRDRYHQPVQGKHVLCNAAPVLDGDQLCGAVTAEREITEQMRLSSQLARSNTQVSNLQRKIEKINRPTDAFTRIVGNSLALHDVVTMAKRVAMTDVSILIRGESGTGKELFAEAIHKAGPRHDKPFVVINCAAIPPNLFESELFGYEPGSFTGADRRGRKGKFDLADQGTLFLDEIGELPLEMQVKLLRVLQNQRFYRVGGSEPVAVNVRVISATNRDLEKLISDGLFRDDLYYRINVVSLEIPPLRERDEDIDHLVQLFVREFCMKQGVAVKTIDETARRALRYYSWPGNVRELRNVAERMVVLCEGDSITLEHLPGLIKFSDEVAEEAFSHSLSDARGKTEREMILNALENANGDRSRAARLLGVPRSTLYYKLRKYNISGKD